MSAPFEAQSVTEAADHVLADEIDEEAESDLDEAEGTPSLINLLHYDSWHEVPEGWFEAFDHQIYGLAEHKHAFIFGEDQYGYQTDLVPLARTALEQFFRILGTVPIDPNAFGREVLGQFSPVKGELQTSYFVHSSIVGDGSNWLGDLVTLPHNGRPTTDRVLAVDALLDALSAIPPIEPLNARIDACSTVARALRGAEHRDILVNGGFQDVYALIERLAEQTDAQLLSDLCRPLLRMLGPVTILDELGTNSGTTVPAPTAVQIAAIALQWKETRTGSRAERPAELLEAFGSSRALQLDATVDLDALHAQATAWVKEVAVSDDHYLVRRWLSAAWELDVRIQFREPTDEVWSSFRYEELYDTYIEAAAEASDTTTEEPPALIPHPESPHPDSPHTEAQRTESLGEEVDAVLAELDAIIGQSELKKQVRQLVAQVKINKKREEHGRKGGASAVHMVFTGPPGTGKTTIARLIGRLYRAIGVLPTGTFTEVDRTDLVAAVIGGTEANTAAAISDAMGGVLLIDEAYALVDGGENDFGKQAITTLLKALTDHRGEFVCIVAGYPDKMKKFLDSNPGMKSRFARTITFAPYTAAELVEIAVSMASAGDNHLDDGARNTLRLRLSDKERRGGFTDDTWGNAREVENIIEEAAAHRDLRISEAGLHDIDSITTITEADIAQACAGLLGGGTGVQESTEDVLAELNQQIGQEPLKRQVRVLLANARASKAQAEADGPAALPSLPHLIFAGPPGTGKTTIARLLARLYKSLGVLPSGQVVEVDKGGLVAGFIGQTALKTTEKIDEAIGGVLFIDEAYSLASRSENDFSPEVIATLLKRMEDDRGKFLVIAAGYSAEMDGFLKSNVGLSRRFPIRIEFSPYSADELARITELMCANARQQLTDDARELLRVRLESAEHGGLFAQKDWGNGGSARNIVEEAISVRNLRIYGDPTSTPSSEERITLAVEDIDAACDKFLGIASPAAVEPGNAPL